MKSNNKVNIRCKKYRSSIRAKKAPTKNFHFRIASVVTVARIKKTINNHAINRIE